MAMMGESYEWLRKNMVENQIKARGVRDKRVLDAFLKIPRHIFVGPDQRPLAYEDHPLPIEHDQTISQPYIVALMTEALELKGDEKVLEIGTGSGYQTVILAELAGHVYTIERFEKLSRSASILLGELGYENVAYRVSDGTKGWPEEAPFDGILAAAASEKIPPALVEQLAPGGKLVIPVGDMGGQELLVVSKDSRGNITRENLGGCRFLPLVEQKDN